MRNKQMVDARIKSTIDFFESHGWKNPYSLYGLFEKIRIDIANICHRLGFHKKLENKDGFYCIKCMDDLIELDEKLKNKHDR